MTRHRQQVRPRYGRIALLASSVGVTAIAVLGGSGLLPSASTAAALGGGHAVAEQAADHVPVPKPSPRSSDAAGHRGHAAPTYGRGSADAAELHARGAVDQALPARSGSGRRVVFSQNRQRVWLVGGHDRVQRTYLVSGSLEDNLDRGTYEVYSRSEHAWGIDDSGTMRNFVRFAHGQRAAIGFHDIPVDHGRPVQSSAELGTPQSHGCIRQRRADALALWRFAPLGTTVVVV